MPSPSRRARQNIVKVLYVFSCAAVIWATCGFFFRASLLACDVPVYEYALERWPVDPYDVIVFHKGELRASDRKAIEILKKDSFDNQGFANYILDVVDVEGKMIPSVQKVWERHKNDPLPLVVVRYPMRSQADVDAWAAPLSPQTAKELIDSPMRQRIAKELVNGAVAVWIVLESGKADADEAVVRKLKTQLQKIKKQLQGMFAEMQADLAELDDTQGARQLPEPKFVLLRLSRKDARETALINMLLHSEEDLTTFDEPMAFPIFGRGRVLYALVGKGITKDNIEDTCGFLAGPCSCQAKAANPGLDLLINMDWDGKLGLLWAEEEEPPAAKPPTNVVPPSKTLIDRSLPEKESLQGNLKRAVVRGAMLFSACILVGAGVVVFLLRRKAQQ